LKAQENKNEARTIFTNGMIHGGRLIFIPHRLKKKWPTRD
jgi:hypothetical protein